MTRIEVPDVPTTSRAPHDAAPSPRSRPRPRRRPRLVPDSTGVRLREHAARDRDLLELLERIAAA